MNWESDETKEVRDRTKYLWYGIGVLFLAMIGALWAVTRPSSEVPVTRAYVKHILIQYERGDPANYTAALEHIGELRERLLAGEDFSALARRYSDDEFSAPRGGDIGWVVSGNLVDNIDEYIWQAPLNQISDVIRSSHGLHLVVVTRRELSEADRYELELRRRVFGGGESPQETGAEPPTQE